MKLYAKQKMFSLRGNFEIFDEADNPVYQLQGEFDILGRRKLHLLQHGKALAFIKEKASSWTTVVNVYEQDIITLTIRKKIWAFKPTYTIEGQDWIVKGDFFQYNYEILNHHGDCVAVISKKLFKLMDTFEIDIVEPNANIVHILSIVMTIHTDMQKTRVQASSAAT